MSLGPVATMGPRRHPRWQNVCRGVGDGGKVECRVGDDERLVSLWAEQRAAVSCLRSSRRCKKAMAKRSKQTDHAEVF